MAETDDKKPADDDDDDEITPQFQLSPEDLAAIAAAKSKVVPSVEVVDKTPFTIENAPVAKSILRPYRVEKPTPLVPPKPKDDDSK
jgi:hypothetical protein